MPSSSKQAQGRRRVVAQVDYVALSRDLVDAVESGVYIVQAKKFVYVNPFFAKLTGYSREELIGTRSLKLVLPHDRPSVRKKATRNLKSRLGSRPYEYRFIKKNGEVMWVLERVSPIEYMGHKATLGALVDITERKQLEEAIAQSEERYRTIPEQMQDSYYEADLAGNFTFVNDSFCGSLGYAREELVGNNYRLVAAGKEIKPLFRAFNQVYRTGEPNKSFVNEVIRKDGSVKYYESSIAPQLNERGETIGFRCVGRDITERKRAEEALQKSEEQFRTSLENAPDGIYMNDLNGIFLYCNRRCEEIVGYKLEELIGKKFSELNILPENGLARAAELLQKNIRGESTGPDEFEIIRKDGRRAPVEINTSVVFRGGEKVVLAFARDITERKKVDEKLRQGEEKYRALVENINDVFYILDNQGNISYVSPVVERFTQYKVSDLVGKPFTPLIYPDDLPGLLDSFNRLVSGQLEPWEFRIVDKDGRIIFVRTSSRPIYEDGEIVGVTALMADITERKQLEQKLVEMATHDFLTGLPNRVLLLDRFTIAAALARRNKARLAVMSLDLDKFKTINDTLGHDVGDQVLKAVGTRLTGRIRTSDTVARIGGDEFILVMLETSHMEDAAAAAQKILDSFTEPLSINGHQLHLTTSIGIAIYPENAEDLETLTKKSDAAMYYSKAHGRNQFKFFGDGDVQISGVD